MPSEHAYPLTIDNLAKAPGMGVSGTSEEAFLASEISTKNNGWVGWVWGRQPVVTQLSSALPPKPGGKQLVAVLTVEQLSRHG